MLEEEGQLIMEQKNVKGSVMGRFRGLKLVSKQVTLKEIEWTPLFSDYPDEVQHASIGGLWVGRVAKIKDEYVLWISGPWGQELRLGKSFDMETSKAMLAAKVKKELVCD